MKTSTKLTLITVIFAAAAFLSGHTLFPPSTDMAPTAAQLPWFMVVGAIEALAFGYGVAFLSVSLPKALKLPSDQRRNNIVNTFALTWLLVSWWPHDGFHQMIGMNMQKLLYIEYGFHVTLIIAGVIVANSFCKFLKRETA